MDQAASGGELVYDAIDEVNDPESEAKTEYTLLLNGPDLTFKRVLSSEVALAVMNLVMGGMSSSFAETPNPPQRAATSLSRSVGISSHGGRPPRRSLREYIDSTGATQYPQKILAIADFLGDELDLDKFSREEVKAQFSVARERLPSNYTRDFNVALQNGWLAEDHVSKKFYVTATGHAALEQQFSSDMKRISRPPRRRTRRKVGNGESDSA